MKKSHPTTYKMKRRTFLKTSSGVLFILGSSGILAPFISCKQKETIRQKVTAKEVTAWVQLTDNGQVIIYNPAAEMGQGSMTSLPLIFNEEFDADWSKIEVDFSPQVPEIYGSEGWGGRRIQLSAGSRVTKGYFNLLRRAGAQARYILMHSVANHWMVPVSELSTSNGMIFHLSNNQEIAYEEVIPFLVMPDPIPEFTNDELKPISEFQYIGKDKPRFDIPSKVNGKAQFAIDVRLPDMLYGVIERGLVHGAQPQLQNESEILELQGVKKVVTLDHGIGIIAEKIEWALAAKAMLNITWSNAKVSGFNSQQTYEKYAAVANQDQPGEVIIDEGNFTNAYRSAFKKISVDYKNDYVYHAQMEPLNAVVKVAEGQQSAEVWVGSQQGFTPKMGVPQVLGISPDKVKVNLMYLGGGFGRRSMTDFVEECAHLAKEVAPLPVKLIWTREDDITYGAYRPMSLQRLKAGVDRQGNITSFSHLIIGDGDNLLASGIRNDFYNIPHQHAELRIITHGVRLKHWRSVGHGPNKYAIECMIDEVAHELDLDPIAMRKKLMANAPRARATLEKAADMCNWGQPLPGDRARGVAFLERSGTLSTGICEISLNTETGKIRVHHFWSAHDAGIVVQPDNVKAQIEGGIIMGMSSVLKEQLTIVDGKVQQSNFDNYELLRMEDIPETIETAIIESSENPQGVGESGTPLVGAAIANAFLALTGKRLRHLPFTKERVKKVLMS